jgi:anti-sigma regulatory factor (Ser/Thr protein kinase)
MGLLKLKLKNDLDEIDRLFESIRSFGEAHGLSRKQAFQLNLVIEELFTNIVSYAYRDSKEHWIHVTISCGDGRLSICIEDDGIPFNPITAGKPDLDGPVEDRKVGGLGIHLCKEMMNNMQYRRKNNRNILTLTKTLPTGN